MKVFYSPEARISAVKLNLINKPNLSNKNETKLIANVYINKYRKCIETNRFSQINSYNFIIEFVCEANSYEDIMIEMKNLTNSMIISFNNINRELILVGISVFKFEHNCGDHDIPLNTDFIPRTGKALFKTKTHFTFQSKSEILFHVIKILGIFW